MTRDLGMDRCKRKKNSPRYEPDGQRNADHHTQETYEKVAVKPVDIFDFGVIRVKDRSEPS